MTTQVDIHAVFALNFFFSPTKRKFYDTKGVIRSCNPKKDRQYNGQNKSQAHFAVKTYTTLMRRYR
jgi:hypothetical protein